MKYHSINSNRSPSDRRSESSAYAKYLNEPEIKHGQSYCTVAWHAKETACSLQE